MLTNPGTLPKNQVTLDQTLMSNESSQMFNKVKYRLSFINESNAQHEDSKDESPEATDIKMKHVKELYETFKLR
jgi:hypothetical protein